MAQGAIAAVGDDETSLGLVHLNLTRRGYAVFLALVSQVDAGWAPPGAHDVLVIDLEAPEPLCWELAARVRAQAWATASPLLILTVCDPYPARLAALLAHGHVRKPWSVPDLISALEHVLATTR
jgi:DNA-binding response OmpR family regulator